MSYKTQIELTEEDYEKARDKFSLADYNFRISRKEEVEAHEEFLLAEHNSEVARRKKIKAQSDMFNTARAADEAVKNAREYIINPHL